MIPNLEKYPLISSSLVEESIPPTKIFLQVGRDLALLGSMTLSLILCGPDDKTASTEEDSTKVMNPNPRGLKVKASNFMETDSTDPKEEK